MIDNRHLYYLQTMGIEVWFERHANISATKVSFPAETSTWESLRQCVANCQICDLHKTRTQTVFGVGTTKAELLIVGEAPGEQEDLKGEPFVGRAGKLLDNMLKAIGLDRKQIYIANVLKCRPPKNRDPSLEEVAKCTPFLNQQIAMIRPKLILAVGRIAAHYLLKTNLSMTKMRMQEYEYGESKTPLIVTFHPAYLLRSPNEKAKAYEDLLKVKKKLLEAFNTMNGR